MSNRDQTSNQPDLGTIYPGIYSLRALFEADFSPSLCSKEIGNLPVEFISIANDFEVLLRSLIEEIFNTDLPFVQTENEEHCKYCSYRQICRK